MDLSIVIVTYKSRAYIERCLDALARHKPTVSHEIFVVDNASNDGTVELLRSQYPNITVLQNQQNEGFSRANNRAIERAKGEYVLLLNPDTEVTAGAIDQLVAKAKELDAKAIAAKGEPARNGFGALAPRLQYPDGGFQPNFYRFPSISSQLAKLVFAEKRTERRVRAGEFVPVDCAWGAALLIPRLHRPAQDVQPHANLAPTLTLLDRTIFLYSEDLELCWRLKKTLGAHGQTYILGSAVITHAHNKSGEQLYGNRVSVPRLQTFKKTMRYVTTLYWTGPFKSLRFWKFCQLEALNANWRRLLLSTIFRSRYPRAERIARQAEHSATARAFSGRAETTPPVTRAEISLVLIALTLFVALSLTIATLLPRGRGNDEDSHVAYVRYVADYGSLPQPFPIDFGVNREFHQPPLYYLTGAAWLHLVRPLHLGIDSLRLLAVLMGLVQFWLLWKFSRLVLPQGWRVIPLLFFSALPMLVHEFATANNDALSYLMVTGMLIALLHIWKRPTTTGWYLVAALAGSGAVLSKLFAAPAVLIFGLAITIVARHANKMRAWAVALLVAAIPLGLWLLHNHTTAGLWLPEIHLGEQPALAPYKENVTLPYIFYFWIILWETFIGRYGSWDIVFPIALYAAYLVPVGVAIAGAFLLPRDQRLERRLARWTGAAFVAELAALAYLNKDYFQPQARYLYPILAALLVVFTLGLQRFKKIAPLKVTAAVLTILAVVVLVLSPDLLS